MDWYGRSLIKKFSFLIEIILASNSLLVKVLVKSCYLLKPGSDMRVIPGNPKMINVSRTTRIDEEFPISPTLKSARKLEFGVYKCS